MLPNSILNMPNVESLRPREGLEMALFFNDATVNDVEYYPYLAQARMRRQYNLARADAFEKRLRTYKQTFQNTYYKLPLKVVGMRRGREQVLPVILNDGEWAKFPCLLREVVKLVVEVELLVSAEAIVAVRQNIERLVNELPSLERVAIVVRCDVGGGMSKAIARYLGVRFNNLAERKRCLVEVGGSASELLGQAHFVAVAVVRM